ncbi:uncharacterized protein A1O5_05666 [Cladophialophora psammophila CBS 110553]|uniref:Uncharacterized protein n=1 Tax=Cladophialophora psammophila CBS 110553 TaxID=1182543 RepID=W9X167_9EURO|nr:uncharacterized protein A1O5_05666 [Cladophialophora psammophila CBS 110553]EXJ70676.1 hypothetical protein A1O5_05666 [Cladophialophora psammophila CBS 110553]
MTAAKHATLKAEAIKDSVYAHVSRDAQESDLLLDEFDYNASLPFSYQPRDGFGSLQDVLDTLEHETLLSNCANFSSETSIECLDTTKDIYKTLNLNLACLPNMIGRPDYWAPQAHW